MSQAQWFMKSPVGALYVVASDLGLQGLYFETQEAPLVTSLKGSDPAIQILSRAAQQLEQYFAGKLTKFDLPLDLQGTSFQKKVWSALSEIPFGRTCSYQDIARKIKNEKAVRAVGTANGRNPLCIIVPCHRVIASDGTLGGYSGGLHVKTKLLDLEGNQKVPGTFCRSRAL